MDRRILIVGTSPYDINTPARAFESYFHFCKPINLAQIFTINATPAKGHCATLFRITDSEMLNRWLGRTKHVGTIFKYDELSLNASNSPENNKKSITSVLYRIGHNKNAAVYLLRGILWRKSIWNSQELNLWLEDFNPECVFLSFSDDYFIPRIALCVAKKFNIPIISSIGDDYYFNYKRTISPLYHLYKLSYRKLIRSVFAHGGSAIYIGDKIRDKYNEEFHLSGETTYLTSSISRREFKPISKDTPIISYFGNIKLGRNDSLADIADALYEINPDYKLHVYSNEHDRNAIKVLTEKKNICYHGSVPYDVVKKRTIESDILVVVEGFLKKDVDITRYSLSTKVADSLASGVSVFAYGSIECGAIEYLVSTKGATVCTDRNHLIDLLSKHINDSDYQNELYRISEAVVKMNHSVETNASAFMSFVDKCVERYNNE